MVIHNKKSTKERRPLYTVNNETVENTYVISKTMAEQIYNKQVLLLLKS